MLTDKSIPLTNLVAHQKLLQWYQDAQSLKEKTLCPLMAYPPGGWSSRILLCDIPKTRKLFMRERKKKCCQKEVCVARKRMFNEARNELWGEPLRKNGSYFEHYGQGSGEPLYKRRCVICATGQSYRCYLEFGSDPLVREKIKRSMPRPFLPYQKLAESLLRAIWKREEKAKVS